MLKTKAIFGGGPVILVITLLGTMHVRAKKQPPNPQLNRTRTDDASAG